MKSRVAVICLLGSVVSAASGTDAFTTFAVAPPTFLKVRVQKVDVPGVCVDPKEDYFLYISPSGSRHSALIVDMDGITRYQKAPVSSANCSDSSLAWPTEAVGYVRENPSTSDDAPPAQLVISASALNACHLLVDLKLRIAPACSPPNKGQFE